MVDDHIFRKAMSKFATGVTVVTALVDEEIVGMTVNAFMSISLQPKLVAVSIDEKASMYNMIQDVKQFGISILKEDQEDLSMIFANQQEKDRKIAYTYKNGIPVLDDTLATISCTVYDMVKAGDHMIFIGKVMDINVSEGAPLLYFNSNYEKIDFQ